MIASLLPTSAREAAASARPPRVGLVGGGQLARLLGLAALPLGCEIVVLAESPHHPAARLSPDAVLGAAHDPVALRALANRVDVVLLENEFVDAPLLAALEATGTQVVPRAASLALAQDKLLQKQTLAEAGLPVTPFRAVSSPAEIAAAGVDFGWPLVLKSRRHGYDGKGNVTLRHPDDIPRAWSHLARVPGGLLVEQFWPFAHELAVMVTRSITGECAVYPVVETVQQDHVCRLVKAPAPVAHEIADRAASLARRAVAAFDGLGTWGVEMFLAASGQVVVNEMAPRVHNSGHYTIEACVCSQFENHLRAALGWPLGSTALLAPAAAMVNLLGSAPGPGHPHGLATALRVPGAHVHLYGKGASAPGRKLGHVTALGRDLATAVATAETAARHLRFENQIA